MREDLINGVKKVMVVFLLCFLALITYIAYFTAFKAPDLAVSTSNKRLWAKRNEVLRGTIYDRNGKALTTSERKDVLEQKRTYVYGPMFAHVIGYSNQKYDIVGLEKKYDEELMNTKNLGFNVKEALKNFNIKMALENRQEEQKIGNSLKTSLSYDLQKVAYDSLGDNKGAVVAINPKTGEILAMVSKPSFDPNNLDEVMKIVNDPKNKDTSLINRASQGLYPPGSTFKVVTTTSALQNIQGIKEKTFEDTGKLSLGGNQYLNNYGGYANGTVDLANGFRKSSNFVFGTLGMELGNEKLKSTAEKFYFNKVIPTEGIPVSKSQFPTIPSYEKGSLAQCGIGQSSILASPLQMALVASTVANDGVMMEPKLVNEVLNFEGKKVRDIESKKLTQVMSKGEADTITTYMRSVIENGTVDSSLFSGLKAAGKTGTADFDEDGKPAPPHSWFIGFAPSDNPKIAVAVIVEKGGVGGGKAANIASKVLNSYLGGK